MRDIFLQLGALSFCNLRWTSSVHDEWIDSLLLNRPDIDELVLSDLRVKIDREFSGCLVVGYEDYISSLVLPDMNDCHILAGAIVSSCDVIVIFNVRDFPSSILGNYGIVAIHPDDFLLNFLLDSPSDFCFALRLIRMRLKNPSYTVDEYLGVLSRVGLPKTVSGLVEHRSYF